MAVDSNEWAATLYAKKLIDTVTLHDLAARGIRHFRDKNWTILSDHIEMDIIDDLPGPWFKLYSKTNKKINGKNPMVVSFLELNMASNELLPFDIETVAAQQARES